MASNVYCRGDLGIQRGVTVAVAADHLPDLDVLGIAGEGGGNRPALEAGLKFWRGHGVEMVEDPDRIPPSLIGNTCDPRHGLVLLDGIVDLRQVHPPTLRHEYSESDWHWFASPSSSSSLCDTCRAASYIPRRSVVESVSAHSRGAHPDTPCFGKHRSLLLLVWQSLFAGD